MRLLGLLPASVQMHIYQEQLAAGNNTLIYSSLQCICQLDDIYP